jgi:hypothetical protein
MMQIRKADRILVEKPDGRGRLGRPSIWEDNIKMEM